MKKRERIVGNILKMMKKNKIYCLRHSNTILEINFSLQSMKLGTMGSSGYLHKIKLYME